jgi:acyl carrier protein
MGLDSVELVMAVEEAFSVTISDAEAEQIQTPAGMIDCVTAKLEVTDDPAWVCPTMRAFHRIRGAVLAVQDVPRRQVQPSTSVLALFPSRKDEDGWSAFANASGFPALPKPRGWFGIPQPSTTLADLSRWVVSRHLHELKPPGERWTRREIRAAVRFIISEQLGIVDFDDEDEFVRDLGVD